MSSLGNTRRSTRHSSPAFVDVVVGKGSSPPSSCAYSERVCQRPVASPSKSFCWAHSNIPKVAKSEPDDVQVSTHQEASGGDLMRRLTANYLAPVPQSPGPHIPKPENPTNNLEYFEALGSINVDDPTAPFCSLEDSISDDGSDEFGYALPLGHAGVYSAEEVVSMTCDRMQRLRQLYVDELNQIGVQLRLSRRRYLADVARDRRRRIGDPLADYIATTPDQRRSQKKLAAMRRQGRCYPSADTTLQWSLRAKSCQEPVATSVGQQAQAEQDKPQPTKCSFASCEDSVLPLTKFCPKHILLDRRQLLFTRCPGVYIQVPAESSAESSSSAAAPDGNETPAPKVKHIDCGRLALQAPTLSGRHSAASSSAPCYCSYHRVIAASPVTVDKTK